MALVEFARSDLVSALRVFDEADLRSQVIHVSAPDQLRAERLRRRVAPPMTYVSEQSINVEISDNHLLPSTAERSLYSLDGLQALKATPRWRGQIFEIDNSVDDDGSSVEAQLHEFTDHVVAHYRKNQLPHSSSQHLAS